MEANAEAEDVGSQTISVSLREIVSQVSETRHAYLIVIGGSSVGRMYRIAAETFVVGRDPQADIIISDGSVSRRHAEIVHQGDELVLRDLESTNGVYVNGVKVQLHRLSDGDKVQIGSTTILKFSYQDELEENFQQQLYESATRDPLTGAFNKKFFLEHLAVEFSYATRHNKPLSLLLFDLDHFKRVNDTHGHRAGDFVLREAATAVRRVLRAEDCFSRYGGEEFAIVLRGTEASRAFMVAERIRGDVAAHPFSFEGRRIELSLSAGVATLREANYASFDELLQSADDHLYRAKARGRNRTESDAVTG